MPSAILLFGLLLIYIAITGRLIAMLNGFKALMGIISPGQAKKYLKGQKPPKPDDEVNP